MDEALTQENLLKHMQQGHQELQTFIAGLNPQQLTQPTDAAGWTIKDHLIHLAVWMDGVYSLLNHQSRAAAMGFDEAMWEQGEDAINGFIQQQQQHRSLDDVLATLEQSYQRLRQQVAGMSDEALLQPYRSYAPQSTDEAPVFWRVTGNTFQHSAEHIPWMRAIAHVNS